MNRLMLVSHQPRQMFIHKLPTKQYSTSAFGSNFFHKAFTNLELCFLTSVVSWWCGYPNSRLYAKAQRPFFVGNMLEVFSTVMYLTVWKQGWTLLMVSHKHSCVETRGKRHKGNSFWGSATKSLEAVIVFSRDHSFLPSSWQIISVFLTQWAL